MLNVKLDIKSGCLNWKAYVNDNHGNYPKLSYTAPGTKKKQVLNGARVLWILLRGKIPDGKEVCHTCDNNLCMNINHLYLDDHKSNVQYRYWSED